MKNKNMHIFEKNISLFQEKRLVFQVAPKAAPAIGTASDPKVELERSKDNLRQLVLAISNADPALLGGLTADQILENNPLAENLIEGTKGLQPGDFEVVGVKDTDAGLMLNMKDGRSVNLPKEMSWGLLWPSLNKSIRQLLPEKEFPDGAVHEAIKRKNGDFEQFIDAININRARITHPAVPQETVDKAKNYLVKFVIPELPKTVAKDKIGLKAELGRDKIKKDVEETKKEKTSEELEAAFSVELSQDEVTQQLDTIDWWVANTRREYEKINADKWNLKGQENFEKIRNDWILMGIPAAAGQNVFYDKIFKELSKVNDKQWNKQFPAGSKEAKMYADPQDHEAELQKFDPDFYRAHEFYKAVKQFAVHQDNKQNETLKKQGDLETQPIIKTAMDAVKDNVKEFTKSIREGDWATAGMYLVGIWAIYKTYKNFGPDIEHSGIGKYLILGAAIFCGNEFAKKAGYDLAKKLGIKENDAEVQKTPMAALTGLEIPEVKDIDAAILLRSASLDMEDLHAEYIKTHPGGDTAADRFINPAQFSTTFPEFANFAVADKDHDKSFKHTGKQLYLIAHVLRRAYEKTMMINKNQPYYNIPFEDALKMPGLKDTQVEHLLGIVQKYNPEGEQGRIWEPSSIKKAKERIQTVLQGTGLDGGYELGALTINGKDAVAGRIMGFPIAIRPDPANGVYIIFSKKDYLEKKGLPSDADALGKIPYEGDASTNLNDLSTKIVAEVEKLVKPLYSPSGLITVPPHFDGGKWLLEITFPDAKEFDITATKAKDAQIKITDSGQVNIVSESLGLDVNIDYFIDQATPYAGILISRMAAQKGMEVFAPFVRSGKIVFVGRQPSDASGNPIFTVEVVGQKIDVTYNKTTKAFEVPETVQEELLKNPRFRREYVEEISKSDKFSKPFERLKALIDNDTIPEEFHFYIFSGIARMIGQITKADPIRGIGLDFLSGSASEYYAEGVLEAQKQFLKYRLEGALKNAKNFQEARDIGTSVWHDALAELDGHVTRILEASIKHKTAGTAFDRDEFMGSVVDPLRRLGTISAYYREAFDNLERDAVGVFKLGGSDLTTESHRNLAKLKGVFAYYTAYLDGDELNKLKFPPDRLQIPPGRLPRDVPEYDGYFRLEYFKYVRLQIIEQGQTTKTNFPDPEAWDIDSYEVWKERQVDALPLDPIDAQGPFKHDPNAMTPGPDGVTDPTELETYYQDELIEMRDEIKKIDGIVATKVNNYMKTPEFAKQFSADITTIHQVSGSRRSLQIQEVQRYVGEYAVIFLTDKSFWINYPAMDKLRVLWRQLVTKIKE